MVDMVPEARRVWKEITESDGGESGLMKMVRLMADDIEGWEQAFDLYWNANRRATALWQAAHPDEKALFPDQGKMISWLCDELEKKKAVVRECLAIVETVLPDKDWTKLREEST